MDSLPIPAPAAWESDVGQILGRTGVQDRFLELTFTAWDLAEFAKDCGYEGPPFRWNESRRSLICAELDALYLHLYRVERQNAEYILSTFPTLRRKDESRWGEYRTSRVILEIYDAMSEAQQSDQPYTTRLDPPPASPLVAHPARTPDTVQGDTP
jgi:hypothetical protein